jgi:hypothetical protein
VSCSIPSSCSVAGAFTGGDVQARWFSKYAPTASTLNNEQCHTYGPASDESPGTLCYTRCRQTIGAGGGRSLVRRRRWRLHLALQPSQIHAKIRGRLVTLVAILLERLGDDLLEPLRCIAPPGTQSWRLLVKDRS